MLITESLGASPVPFTRFGPSRFSLPRRTLRRLDVSRDAGAMRADLRAVCPLTAGVYGWVDGAGTLIYVGYSQSLQTRLLTYFSSGERGGKERRVARHSVQLVWEAVGHPLAAQLRELELIRRFHPRFNRQGRNDRDRLGYLTLTAEAAPRVRVARRLPAGATRCWGPLPVTRRLHQGVDALNRALGLADCPQQPELSIVPEAAGCLRAETGSCLGPCRGLCTPADYHDALRRAEGLLDGLDDGLVQQAQERMTAAAVRRDYATAARLRDRWGLIASLAEHLRRFRDPRSHSLVYPVRLGRHEHWLAIRQSLTIGGCRAPDSPATARGAERLLAAFDSPRVASAGDIGYQQIANRWFADHPEQAAAGLTPDQAREVCDRRLLGSPRPR